jgi:muramoyltetrapeptide carboxypeptidase
MIKIPNFLQKADTIGITCPAGYMASEKAQACISTLQQWGYRVMLGKTLGSNSNNYFSGTDEERTDELQAMLDDKSIKAILCGRGGYGLGRIIDKLDFTAFKKHPKWIIGFSDITVLHCHLNRNYKIASLHAPMAGAFNDGGAGNSFVQSLKNALEGKKAIYHCAVHPFNIPGKATAELVGGNLTLLTHLIGTNSELKTKGKLLFVEDIGEELYKIDRMFYQLKRAGKLDKLAGLIFGGFSGMKDTDRPFGKTVDEILREVIKDADYPVCFGFPVSHETANVALKSGGIYNLQISKRKVELSE